MSVSDQTIIRTPNPKGTFINCIISGTPKPGTCMQIKAATAAIGGRMTYEVAAPGGDGQRALMAILVEDSLQGRTVSDAYTTGSNATLYCPVAGEELNILFNNVTGTADDVAIGDLLILDNSTGKFNVTTGTVESEPFQALEAITDPTADTLLAAIFTGQ